MNSFPYNLEHNFGHGKQHLSAVLATLNLLAKTRWPLPAPCDQSSGAASSLRMIVAGMSALAAGHGRNQTVGSDLELRRGLFHRGSLVSGLYGAQPDGPASNPVDFPDDRLRGFGFLPQVLAGRYLQPAGRTPALSGRRGTSAPVAIRPRLRSSWGSRLA